MQIFKRTALIIVCAVAMSMLTFSVAQAHKGKTHFDLGKKLKFGLGPYLGYPLGAEAKYWLGSLIDNHMAAKIGTAYDFSQGLLVWMDGIWHIHSVTNHNFPWKHGKLRPYGGFGVGIGFGSAETHLTLRFPVGVSAMYGGKQRQYELFAELVPGAKVNPNTAFTVRGGLGIRYYWD